MITCTYSTGLQNEDKKLLHLAKLMPTQATVATSALSPTVYDTSGVSRSHSHGWVFFGGRCFCRMPRDDWRQNLCHEERKNELSLSAWGAHKPAQNTFGGFFAPAPASPRRVWKHSHKVEMIKWVLMARPSQRLRSGTLP